MLCDSSQYWMKLNGIAAFSNYVHVTLLTFILWGCFNEHVCMNTTLTALNSSKVVKGACQ